MSKMRHEKGAVSLFVVIFTALLITVVTVSFARLMIRDQQRATNNDLSQSAYDAALAGVEDAKRALVQGAPSYDSLTTCNGLNPILGNGAPGDVIVVGDESLNQVYTCVKVYVATDDYTGSLGADTARLVPLRTEGASVFTKVKLEWFSRDDVSSSADGEVDLPSDDPVAGNVLDLDWPENRPPVIEAQLVQTGTSFTVDQFDGGADEKSNTNTLLLYPESRLSALSFKFGADDPRRSNAKDISEVKCEENFDDGEVYACSVDIELPEPIGSDAASRTNSFLRLTSRYNSTNFRVSLYNGDSVVPVKFDNVQPLVDSTGRASNLLRRVVARVEPSTYALYPDAAVEVNGNFCKTFLVTDSPDEYSPGPCVPYRETSP